MAARIVSIHAAEQAALADEALGQTDPTGHAAKLYDVDPSRIEWVNWKGEPMEGDPKELLAAGKLIVATVRPKPAAPLIQRTEAEHEEQLVDQLTGGLAALAGNPENKAF